jgi:hypothetical protein
MNKVLEIRKLIVAQLTQNQVRVFYQKAHEDAVSPYIVADLSNSIDDGTLEQFVLDLDGYMVGTDSAQLEIAMKNADDALHRKTFYVTASGKQLGITFYRENRLTYDETDRRIFRRRYVYQIRTHEK